MRLRRLFCGALVVASGCGLLSVSSASAAQLTVGQLFTPTLLCYGSGDQNFTLLVTGVAHGRSYTVPTSGVITSWSFEDGAATVPGLTLKVGRQVGAGRYKIVADAPAGRQVANSVNTYPANISVKAGDVIGIYENGGNCATETGNSLDTFGFAGGNVPSGTTAFFTASSEFKFPVSVKLRAK